MGRASTWQPLTLQIDDTPDFGWIAPCSQRSMAPHPLLSIEERTFRFALAIVRAYRANLPRDEVDRVIWRQLLRSATSAGANSAECGGSQSRREWITRRHIALKEMRESHFWLRLLQASTSPARPATVGELVDECNQLVAILTATLKTARGVGRQPNEK